MNSVMNLNKELVRRRSYRKTFQEKKAVSAKALREETCNKSKDGMSAFQ